MKTNARALLSLLLVVLATMFLAGCGGSYNCQVTFGSSTCTPSGSGFGGGWWRRWRGWLVYGFRICRGPGRHD